MQKIKHALIIYNIIFTIEFIIYYFYNFLGTGGH